jgi:hypothetical protein
MPSGIVLIAPHGPQFFVVSAPKSSRSCARQNISLPGNVFRNSNHLGIMLLTKSLRIAFIAQTWFKMYDVTRNIDRTSFVQAH